MSAYTEDVLFIHIPKTAGTAAREYMVEHMGAKTDDFEISHIPLRDIERFTGRSPDSFEKIVGIIRDPYKQQISQWWFWHRRFGLGDEHPHCINAGEHPRIHSWLESPNCDFQVWYDMSFGTGRDTYEGWQGYYHWWLSVDGEIPANVQILKTEELSHTLPLALAPYIDGVPPDVPVVNEGEPMPLELVISSSGIERGNQSLDKITAKFGWTLERGYYPRIHIGPA